MMVIKLFAASVVLLVLCAGSVVSQNTKPTQPGQSASGSFGGSGGSSAGSFGGSGGNSGGSGGSFGGSGGSSTGGSGGSTGGSFGGSGGSSSGSGGSFGGSGGSSGGSFGGSGGSSSGSGGSFGGSGGSSGGSFGGSGGSSGGATGSSVGGSGGSFNNYQSIQMCKKLTPGPDKIFNARDIQCNGAINCKVCGGLSKVRDACASKPVCQAFSFNPSTGCGFLKWGAGGDKPEKGVVSYASANYFPSAGISAAAILDMCVTLRPLVDKNVLGNDNACKGNEFCKVCGPPEMVRDTCVKAPNCVGFSYDTVERCGYLKKDTITGLSNAKGWVTYTRA